MKILTFCQYYYPEPFKIHEICESLVSQGNEVTVITGRPNYPDGNLFSGYENSNRMRESINGVNVIRTPIALRGHSPIQLIKNYFSYPIKANQIVSHLNDDYDIIFVYQLSPIFMILPALKYKKKFNKKIYVYLLDLWPESIKVLHIKENNPIFKFIKTICKRIYSKCDFISVTSPAFIKYVNQQNKVPLNKINFIPQHGEDLFLKVGPYQRNTVLNIVFAGNIGKAQDFDCLVSAVKHLSSEVRIKFKITIIGSGSYLESLIHLVKTARLNDSFTFIGRKPVEELIPYFNKADLFLLSLEKGSGISNTIPSKLQTYMAAGRGIIGSIDGDAANIIAEAQAGITCPAGDYKQLAQIISKMIDSSSETLCNYSINSRNYYLSHFTLQKYTESISSTMETLLNNKLNITGHIKS